jgi:hypothetical protein
MTWEPEFFHLAGSWLACQQQVQNDLSTPGRNDFAHPLCRLGYSDLLFEEIELTREMHEVLKEAGMLPAQRLARCAGRLLARGPNSVEGGEGCAVALDRRIPCAESL